MGDEGSSAFRTDRRALLTGILALAAPGAALRCGRPPAAAAGPAHVEVPLEQLPVGTRVVLPVGSQPVEFRRTRAGVAALSLACTHQGCEVVWVEEERSYRCPCHEGVFDETGAVVSGPPPKRLKAVAVEVRGTVAVARL